MNTWYETLFYLLFVSQILLLSVVLPRIIAERIRTLLIDYPPEQYPKLYPRSRDYYVSWLALFKVASAIVALIGAVTLALMLFVVDHSTFASDGYISEAWPAAFGVLQFIPLASVAWLEHKTAALMRQNNISTARQADLRPRRLTDYLPGWLLTCVIVCLVLTVLFDVLGPVNSGSWVWLMLGQAVFVVSGYQALYGHRKDPHQSLDDREHVLKVSLKSLAFGSLAMSVFFASNIADQIYDLDYLDAIIISFYFQAVAMFSIGYLTHNIQMDHIDFDVYKQHPPTG